MKLPCPKCLAAQRAEVKAAGQDTQEIDVQMSVVCNASPNAPMEADPCCCGAAWIPDELIAEAKLLRFRGRSEAMQNFVNTQQGNTMSQELFFVIAAYFPEDCGIGRPEGITGYMGTDFCRCPLGDPDIFVAETRVEANEKLAEFEKLARKLDTDVLPDLECHKVIRVHRDNLEMP